MANVSYVCGNTPVPVGSGSLSLTGLGFAETPLFVSASLRKPDANADFYTCQVVGKPGIDRFDVEFSANIEQDGYVLDWMACVETTEGPSGAGSLSVTYDELRGIVAKYLGYDPADLSVEEAAEVDSHIRSGLRQFYNPGKTESAPEGHTWSFMREIVSVTTTPGTDACLVPNHVGRVEGFIFPTTGEPIPIVGESAFVHAPVRTGMPRIACLRWRSDYGSSGQAREVVFRPAPSVSEEFVFRCTVDPTPLVADTAPYPLGGPAFSEVIIESCLAIAEQRSNDEQGIHTSKFQKMLDDAILEDRRNSGRFYGPMSGTEGGSASIVHPTHHRGITITLGGNPI